MITAWRLVKWTHREDAFSGEGSRMYGNRWNSSGRRVVYASDSQALCALENVVHFEPGKIPPAYAFLAVKFDSKLVRVLDTQISPHWGRMGAATRAIGDEWYDSGSSCILAVPSALVDEGTNFLFNVAHSDFSKVKISPPIAYAFDERINVLSLTT